MSEKKYDSVLCGFAEDPQHDDGGQVQYWKVRFTDQELKEIAEKYATRRNEEGKGGNVYFTLFVSRNGKACCRVYDPNSEGAKEYRAKRQQQQQADDLPF